MAMAVQRPPINPDYLWDQDPSSVQGYFPALARLTSQHQPLLYPNPNAPGGSFRASLMQLLKTLATLLEDSCLIPNPHLHPSLLPHHPEWPFLYPFLAHPHGTCMVFDQQKIRASRLPMWISGKASCRYLEINLGNGFPHTNAVVISAHRLLCWAHKGPVPEGGNVVVEHLCENSMCGNPLHIAYGTKSTNKLRSIRGRGRGRGGMRGRGRDNGLGRGLNGVVGGGVQRSRV
jgi:HNH endonuclease